MRARASAWLIGVAGLALLAPLALVTALIVTLSYPAYPIPATLPQVLFDAAMVLQIAGIVAAGRLVFVRLRRGRPALAAAHGAWMAVTGAGATIGGIGAAIAVAHTLMPTYAPLPVGYALLAPGALLAPLWWLLRRERRAGA